MPQGVWNSKASPHPTEDSHYPTPPPPQPQAGIYQSRTQSTAAYCAVLDGRGELYCAVGDMEVNGSVTPEWVGDE